MIANVLKFFSMKKSNPIRLPVLRDRLKQFDWNNHRLSLKEWLTGWETGSYASIPELLAVWRFDAKPYLDTVVDGYKGPCRIWVEHSCYGGYLADPIDGYLTDAAGKQMVFDSVGEAQEWGESCLQDQKYIICTTLTKFRRSAHFEIIDERSDKSTPLNEVLNQFGVFLDPDWYDFKELHELEWVQFLEEEGIARHPMGQGCWAYIHDTPYSRPSLRVSDKCYSLEEWLATDLGFVNPELFAAWGFDAEPYLDRANEGYEGRCRIWMASTGDLVGGYLMDEPDSHMIFSSFKKAQKWIDEEKKETRLLKPDYIICKA